MTYADIVSKVRKLQGQYAYLSELQDKTSASIEEATALQKEVDKAQALVQQVAKETQEQIKYRLEDIVNLALDTVFPGMYEFKLIFEIKRNKTEARIALLESGVEIDPLDSTGGGLSDVLSFALRVALLMISKTQKVLLLDEPMKFVSEGLKPKVYEIMKRLSDDLGIQIIAVTHDPLMIDIADKVYVVKKEKGISVATVRG